MFLRPSLSPLVTLLTPFVASCAAMPTGALFLSCRKWCCSLHQPSPLVLFLPWLAYLMLFLTLTLTSGAFFFTSGDVSGAILHPYLWCYFTPAGVSCGVSYPAVASIVVSYPSWHLGAVSCPPIASGAVSCPIYRLWCCFLPHLSPLVLLLT
jgi:hypothetical protein